MKKSKKLMVKPITTYEELKNQAKERKFNSKQLSKLGGKSSNYFSCAYSRGKIDIEVIKNLRSLGFKFDYEEIKEIKEEPQQVAIETVIIPVPTQNETKLMFNLVETSHLIRNLRLTFEQLEKQLETLETNLDKAYFKELENVEQQECK